MVLYKCLVCTKEFKLKTDLERHNNRKNKCQPKITDAFDTGMIISTNPPNIPPINGISPPIYTNITPTNLIEVNHHNKQFSRQEAIVINDICYLYRKKSKKKNKSVRSLPLMLQFLAIIAINCNTNLKIIIYFIIII